MLWHAIKRAGVAALVRLPGLATAPSKSETDGGEMPTVQSPPLRCVPFPSLYQLCPQTMLKIICE